MRGSDKLPVSWAFSHINLPWLVLNLLSVEIDLELMNRGLLH